ncbi:pyridoxal-phosphate dependent enzyme [Thioclava sp. GXIMD4216]|uniref:pyridoxal-phosphate dependent enzyme n=1 Tax=Thioclava sp. GXIMD4216 TaxID=3131929 RepID=UPI0030CD5011
MLAAATRSLSQDRQIGDTGFLWNLISPTQFAEIDFGPDLNVVVKFEGSNPGGSIKLKTALALVANCEAAGRLRPGGHVIESSSGNLGIALAMVCANRGYKFTCVVDPNAAKDSLELIRALGGNLVVVSERDANGGYLGSRIAYIETALARDPALVWTNQYANPANPEIHARTTANEILMTYPEVDYLVVGAGTTGTLMGCLSRFHEVGHPAKIIAVDVQGSVTFGGPSGTRRISGLGTSQPSGSLKDRASAIAVTHAREAGYRTIATASTGNAAAALACLAANAGLHAVVYVPETTPAEKLLSIRAYGAEVVTVAGSYDMAFAACLHAAQERGWYLRSTAINPLMTEGKKTAAYEICEQLAWRAPETVFVGVGDGSIIGGLHKGFSDLLALGWIGSMPRIFGVQVAGSNFLYRAWGQKIPFDQVERRSASSIADSLQAELPQDRFKALDAVTRTAGAYVEVSDDQVLDAMRLMARCGYLVEPAAAAACAGAIRAREQDLLGPRSEAVIVSTGNGLKDISSLRRMIAMPYAPK